MYLPVQMGHAIHPDIGYTGDDTGENISDRNWNFCELTGLYWAWKNIEADYIGLVHYRRYFASRANRFAPKRQRVIRHEELDQILATTNVILPQQLSGAISGYLSLGQSLLLVWPHLVGLLALTIIMFALSYICFMRKEIRAR